MPYDGEDTADFDTAIMAPERELTVIHTVSCGLRPY